MQLVIVGLAFLIAALCATTMGVAGQRGATCTVAAMDEVIRAPRLAPSGARRGISLGWRRPT